MAPQDPNRCPVCELPSAQVTTPDARRAVWSVECRRCGTYDVARTTAIELELSPLERAGISGFLRHERARGAPKVTLTSTPAPVAGLRVVAVADALATRPRRTGDITSAFLLAVARTIRTPGGQLQLTPLDAPLVYSLESRDLYWLTEQLVSRGLLRHSEGNDFFNLTIEGWARVDDLERGATPTKDQAFVAMWFDAAMDAAYANAIHPAIEAAGFRPYRIKDVEHNNKICDEILAEIRRSRFVVAEFSGNRGGVYFEAGFAMGLGLPVVWVVREEDLKAVHFDTNHFNHITWTTVDELRTKLQRRIEATIPRPVKA